MARNARLTVLSLAALALGACAGLPGMGALDGGPENFAAGSALSGRLSGADRTALEGAFLAAMESGEARRWRGRRAAGEVAPGARLVGNLFADAGRRVALARSDIDLARTMETELGLYVVKRNANVRLGPGTDYKIAEEMASGAGVDVVGRVVGAPWMLVARNGAVRGYVHENLLIKAPGSEFELAGGPRRRPTPCRAFAQKMKLGGLEDAWEGAACNDGAGWRLAPSEPAPAEDEDEGLDY